MSLMLYEVSQPILKFCSAFITHHVREKLIEAGYRDYINRITTTMITTRSARPEEAIMIVYGELVQLSQRLRTRGSLPPC